MLVFVLVFHLVVVAETGNTCKRDETIEANKYIVPTDGGNVKTTAWSDGEKFTFRCRQGTSTMAWSNNVRKTQGVDLSKIDEYSSTARDQRGEVTVICTDGKFAPNIFAYDVATWCAPGCNKVPEDFVSYWAVDYPVTVVTRSIKKAPIAIEIDYSVTLKCRDGYAQATADEGKTSVYCTNTGWSPSMLYWPACVPGCTDATKAVKYGKTLAAPSTTAGKPPFVTGQVVEFTCIDGYTIKGATSITCTSGQSWNKSPPWCLSNSGTVASSSLSVAVSRTTLLILFAAVYYQMYYFDNMLWDRLI